MSSGYDVMMKDARKCKDYKKCLLCHGCRNFTRNDYKCTKCSMFPKMICKHTEKEIIRGFELMYKDTRPKIEIRGGS